MILKKSNLDDFTSPINDCVTLKLSLSVGNCGCCLHSVFSIKSWVFYNPCISRIFFYLVMLLTRLRDYNPEDRNGKINNNKNSNRFNNQNDS